MRLLPLKEFIKADFKEDWDNGRIFKSHTGTVN